MSFRIFFHLILLIINLCVKSINIDGNIRGEIFGKYLFNKDW